MASNYFIECYWFIPPSAIITDWLSGEIMSESGLIKLMSSGITNPVKC